MQPREFFQIDALIRDRTPPFLALISPIGVPTRIVRHISRPYPIMLPDIERDDHLA